MDNPIIFIKFAEKRAPMKIKEGFRGERYLVIPGFITDMMRKDELLSSLHITDIGYYPKAENHFCRRLEPIDEHVLIYCVDGKGFFNINGKKWTIGVGEFFILPPGVAHSYGADSSDPWTIYWIHFAGSLARQYAGETGVARGGGEDVSSGIRRRQDLFEEIYDVLESGLAVGNLRYACSLFHHYLGSLNFAGHRGGGSASKSGSDRVDLAIHYLSENIERHLSLKEIASNCRLSESRLSALFMEHTGHSILNYFNLLKIQRACDLLDNSNLKINQICYKIGIADPYYFSRLFSKIMGMSPNNFRKRPRT